LFQVRQKALFLKQKQYIMKIQSTFRTIACLLFLSNLGLFLSAQDGNGTISSMGAGNATVYLNDYQSSGINPANLGWSRDGKKFHLGLGQVTFSIFSQPLEKRDIQRFFEKDYSYVLQEKLNIVNDFAEAEFNLDGALLIGGISYQDPKWGGISFTVQEKGNWNFQLNQTASEFLFMGWNSDYFTNYIIDPQSGDTLEGYRSTDLKTASELFEGSRFTTLWRRDFTFSYGLEVLKRENFSLSFGAGIKYIKGMGIVNVRSDKGDASISGYSSLSPLFSIDYPVPSPSSRPGDGFESVGSGWGFDLGMSLLIYKKLRLGVAITDIGSINWDGNVYQANWEAKVERIASPGLTTNNLQDILESIVISEDIYDWEGLEKMKVNLPTRFRLGASYSINPKLDLGIDVLTPLNSEPGNLESPMFSSGVLYRPATWVELSSGFISGGNHAFNVPLGATFSISGNWDIGIGVRDVLTLFKQTNPTVSFAFGFIRIKTGTYTAEAAMPDAESEGSL